MEQKSYSASAPGSLMLLGEHAVLHYKEAIVCAIDKRITVNLYPQPDSTIIIRSQELGTFVTTIDELLPTAPYTYVLGVLLHFQAQLKRGCVLEITTDFSSQIGFGSSAAVTVATMAVVTNWLDLEFTQKDLLQQAKEIVMNIQKVGSGADLAASIYGGVIHYNAASLTIEDLSQITKLTAIYSGSKCPTAEVIGIVEQGRLAQPRIYNYIFQGITECVQQAIVAIKQQHWDMLGRLFSIQHGFMVALNVSTPILDALIEQLKLIGVLGAKISGSGLGDCVIGLGDVPKQSFPANDMQARQGVEQISIKVASNGLQYE